MSFRARLFHSLLFLSSASLLPSQEADIATLPEVVVTGKAESLIGTAASASKGQSSAEELAKRPFVRRGELLEVVPGVVITQHSGDGKANQYFLRGFNLDHGTDFGVFIDGLPVNMRTHAHGQGYADLNPLIPELIGESDYRKGPYFADFGDLSAAGAARFRLVDSLDEGIASFTWGEHNYYRGLIADSIDIGPSKAAVGGKNPAPAENLGTLTYALEYSRYDGPWALPEESQRWNGLLRYVFDDGTDRRAITAMGYDGRWRSTDQIPLRAVRSGLIGRFGFIDGSDRGDSARYSLLFDCDHQTEDGGALHADVWAGYYELSLFSNFTYFLDDPVRGDQFEQSERRWQAGGTVRREWMFDFGKAAEQSRLSIGFDTRHDWIDGIGLYRTAETSRFRATRVDDVYEGSAGLFAEAELRFNDWFRLTPGIRGDLYHFDVRSNEAANSGCDWDGIVSPKLGMVFGPWAETEFYLNGGIGFHSNDARGVLTTRDPASGDRVPHVDALVPLYGAEFGVRTEAMSDWVHTFSLWYLRSDSELVYVGDAGTNEAGPGSERYGIELANYWRPADWFTFDSEFTLTHAKFRGAGDDDEIPGSVPVSWSGGITLGREQGFYGALRGRFFGKRPLEESGRIESKDSFQVNARLGYRWKNWDAAVECLNLFDRDDNDIEYFYESQLSGERAAVEDVHFHPTEPRMFRVTVTYRF